MLSSNLVKIRSYDSTHENGWRVFPVVRKAMVGERSLLRARLEAGWTKGANEQKDIREQCVHKGLFLFLSQDSAKAENLSLRCDDTY
jgi:hypothetical protein